MKRLYRPGLVVFALLLPFSVLVASPDGDQALGYKRFVVATLNRDTEPVFGEQVERALSGWMRRAARFELSPQGYLKVQDALKTVPLHSLGKDDAETLASLRPILKELVPLQVQAAVFAEVSHDTDAGKYELVLALVNVEPARVLTVQRVPVEAPEPLENFSTAAEQAVAELVKAIPFDGTLLSRTGETVVLDRGGDLLQAGMHLETITLEADGPKTLYTPTGEIVITRAEPDLAFGRVVGEVTQGSVTVGNKIRMHRAPFLAPEGSRAVAEASQGRGPASVEVETEGFHPHGNLAAGSRIGFAALGLGTEMDTLDTGLANGSSSTSRLMFNSEIWLTARYFFDLNLDAAFHIFRAQLGYRIHFFGPDPGPYLHFKLGYASKTYDLSSVSALSSALLRYSGALLGTGVGMPIGDRLGLGLDVNTLAFPGVTGPVGYGTAHGVFGWDLTLDAYYLLSPTLRLDGNLQFLGNGAQFDGGSVPLSQQSGRALYAYLSYYF